MHGAIQPSRMRRGFIYASLVGICLLTACNAQKADTATAPEDRDRQVAASDESVEAARPDGRPVIDDVVGEAVPEAVERAEIVRPPHMSPRVSEQLQVRSTQVTPDRAAPDSVKMTPTVTGPQMKFNIRKVKPPRTEVRADALAAETGAPELQAGPSVPPSPAMHVENRLGNRGDNGTDNGTDSGAGQEPVAEPYEQVTVFYATDRKALVRDAGNSRGRETLIAIAVAAFITVMFMLLSWTGWRRRQMMSLAVVGLLATLFLGAYWTMGAWSQLQQVADPGVRYGNARGTLAYGKCAVTIPKTHSRGKVERPSILRLEVREDATKHIVLQATQPTAKDEFFDQLRTTVVSAERPEVFVFIHGFNVTFDGAARRTAQIAYDVKFTGAPIFFSWPSQGGLFKYTIDQNNVQWAVPHLKQFLIDVTQKSGAKSVNLIAHSMGNRALTAALRELQLQLKQETALFNQVILAAPDVDAEIFRRDLAPALVQSAQRVTLYASSNDQALAASKRVHGYARAGESGPGLVVLKGIETIDVSTLDTSLLGHSYYGSSNPILLDIHQLIQDSLPAARRPFLQPRPYGSLTYWVFENIQATATREMTHGTQ